MLPAFSGSMIRAANVTELRSFVNEDRVSEGLPQIIWSDVVGPGTPVRAQHLIDIRAGIQTLWDKKGRGPLPPWGQGAPVAGGPIRASHIIDLRVWLSLYESNHDVGVTSTAYVATPVGVVPVNVGPWSADIAALGVKYVRLALNAPYGTAEFFQVRSLATQCASQGVLPLVVLTSGIAVGNHNEPLSQPNPAIPPSNNYIREFSQRAAEIVTFMPAVVNFELWNEPNVDDTLIFRNNFASLIYHASNAMRSVRQLTIVSGGILSTF
jgi:hypothetical protein